MIGSFFFFFAAGAAAAPPPAPATAAAAFAPRWRVNTISTVSGSPPVGRFGGVQGYAGLSSSPTSASRDQDVGGRRLGAGDDAFTANSGGFGAPPAQAAPLVTPRLDSTPVGLTPGPLTGLQRLGTTKCWKLVRNSLDPAH